MAKTETSAVVFARVTAVTRWSEGTVLLREGQRFDPGDPLVTERPDLFVDSDPTLAPRSTAGRRPVRRCWHCGGNFTPTQGSQLYCGPACRRGREKVLSRAARRVVAGPSRDPKVDSRSSAEQLHGAHQQVCTDLGAIQGLIAHLAGRRADDWGLPGRDNEAQVVDRVGRPVADRPGLATLARAEVDRLVTVREQITDWLQAAVRNQRREKDILLNAATFGPGNRVEQARRQTVAALADALGGDDDDQL